MKKRKFYGNWLKNNDWSTLSYREHIEEIKKYSNGKKFQITIELYKPKFLIIRAFYFIPFKTKIYKL